MGNKSCVSSKQITDYGSIDISLSQSYFVAGEDVTGKVILTIKKDYPLRRLLVSAVGQESISIFKRERKVTLLNKTVVLDEAQNDSELNALLPKMLKPGSYEYDFAIPTKEATKLPSTSNYKTAKISCDVKYAVRACLESYSGTIESLKVDQAMIILEKLKAVSNKTVNKYTMVKEANNELGPANLKVRVDFTGIILPLGFELCVDYDNVDCKKTVKEIIAKVTQKVVLRIDDNAKSFLEEKVVAQWRLPGVVKGEKAFFNNRLLFETQKGMQLESSNGMNYRKYYTLSVEPVYNIWGKCTGKPMAEFDVMVTAYCQSRKKEELVVIPERNDERSEIKEQEEMQWGEVPQMEEEDLPQDQAV